MAARIRSGSPFAGRILWLAGAVLLAVLAYTGFWFYAAHLLEARMDQTLADLNGGGVRAHCEEPEAKGFPFRIGLFCRNVFYEDVASGVSVEAGALRSAANVYQPFHILAEVDGPASVTLPFLVPLQARWESLRGSTRLAEFSLERISIEGRNMELSPEEGNGAPLAVLPGVEVHARRQEKDLETAVSFRGLLVGAEIATGVPPLEGRMLASVEQGASLLKGRQLDFRGRSGTIREMVVGVADEDAALILSGPVSIGTDGLVDADLSVRLENSAKVAQVLTRLFPGLSDEVTSVAAALDGVPLQLRIVRGRVFAGFVPLGRLPPI